MVIIDANSQVIDRFFDRATLSRGRAYASAGAVLDVGWESDRTLSGTVVGSRTLPYKVSVDIARRRDGRLESVGGVCSCPVGYDCKHVAAVLLTQIGREGAQASTKSTSRASTTSRRRTASRRAAPSTSKNAASRQVAPPAPPWETVLGAVLEPTGADRRAPEPPAAVFALQFELVVGASGSPAPVRPGPGGRSAGVGSATSAARSARAVEHPVARVRIRPVVRGSSGRWVRQGVSWRTVDHIGSGWFRHQVDGAHVKVLKELRALRTLSSWNDPYARYHTSSDEVWLDAIPSRRVWDLLGEAEDVGIPLVGAGRSAPAVTLVRREARLVLDAASARQGAGITLVPRFCAGAGETPIAAGSVVPLGTPPHGIVWWDETSGSPSGETLALSCARLAEPLTTGRRSLLSAGSLVVPPEHEARFFDEVYPRLRSRVRVLSTDGSVLLPTLPDQSLVLSLHHRAHHRLELTWATGVPESTWREALDHANRQPLEETVAAALTEVCRLVGEHPSGQVLAPTGSRLEPRASLEGMAAARFLSDVLPVLEGVRGLVVEHDGQPLDYREVTEAPEVTLTGVRGEGVGRGKDAGAGEAERDWFDLAVEVRVGGEAVPFVELFVALASGQTHMLLPSGAYFSIEQEALHELAQLISEARALHDTDGERIRVSRYQASLWEDLQRLGVITAQAAEWERSVRTLATSADRSEHQPPAGLRAELRPYQLAGFNWLVYLYELGLGGILADDMGLGKTLQVLALVCHVRQREPGSEPFLVVAPTSVVGNWASECAKFAPELRVETVRATTARRGVTLFDLAAGADVVVTSYALFRLEHEDYEKVDWAGLVLDEAQFAKNAHSHAYRYAKTLPVPFKLAVTGTPMENHLMELWTMFSITSPGLFGSAERFSDFYRLPIERRGQDDRLALLRKRIRPLLLRRSKEQVAADLPAKQEQVIELELAPRHRKLYQTYLQRERQKVLGMLDNVQKNRFEILKSLTVLRQACLDVTLVDPTRARVPSAKLDALMEMLEEVVADGHRVLVFSQFTRFLSMARARVAEAGIAHCYLDGRTRRRTAVLAEFRAGDIPVFLISLKAGGFGLNLATADYCVLLDPWWNPSTEAQAVDRVHRIGQTKNVMVYRLVAKDTIEEKVMALKARKAALVASVIGGGGFESGALSAADIRGLLD